MGRYAARRLLQLIPVLVGTSLLVFTMVYGLGDPVKALFANHPVDPAVARQLRHSLWLDRPLWVQYGHYLLGVAHGDLGASFDGQPVTTLLWTAFPNTLKLTAVAFTIECTVGIGLGVLTALRRGGFLDTAVLGATVLLLSVPVFVTGSVLQYLVGVRWGIAPVTVGAGAPWMDLILPGVVLATAPLATVARLTRATVAENARAGHVRTAVAKGLPRRRVITHHLLRTSLIPVVTLLGTDLGALLGGVLVTERIFNIQGVGYTLYQGVREQNTPTVVGFVTVLVLGYLLVNLLVDLLYALLDPRIRYA
ncbi:ABC transporter permease [Streptacidiphilus sp. EB129]|uniref:ABC transporter permease n=1 Tax=Streptacidiphilus sp. EB129 TaxID=3156262 RepID=UPI003517799D